MPEIDVAIVTPCYDARMHEDHARSVEMGRAQLKRAGISSARFTLKNDSVLMRVRNQCAAVALAAGAKRIIMIDDDIGFAPEALVRLATTPFDVVGAAAQAPLKNWRDASLPRCVWRPSPVPTLKVPGSEELVEVAGLGTGMLMASARVFQALIDQGLAHPYVYPGMPPETWAHLATYFEHALVPLDLDNDPALAAQCEAHNVPEDARLRLEGEDYVFCHKVREAGFPVYLDTTIRLRHWEGRVCHDFSLAEAQAGNPPLTAAAE